MIDERLYQEFRDIGRDIYVGQLTSSHGGNMSVRIGDRIIIKRRGAQLGRLKPEDFVETHLYQRDSGLIRASTELIVHREIYLQTSALVVIHCHPRTAIVLSMSRDEIIPIDNEGSYLLHKIPVVSAEYASGSKEMAEAVAEALRGYKIIMLRGHGCFAVGQTLEEAFHWCSTLEEVSDIIFEARLMGETHIEYRKNAEEYKRW
ncbi:MAG: class II aldolase/adducin family protein [Chloroflexi bacterium]|nr:class II aldolase/adducin family protein [Chloroflexota bacterium]